jgi:hypothetical protein
VGKFFKFGCLGIIGLVIVVAVIGALTKKPEPVQQVSDGAAAPAQQAPASQPGKPEAAKPTLAKIGQTTSLKGWELTLSDFGPFDRFSPSKPPATKAQGALLVADMKIKNLQNSTSNFTSGDFVIKSPDGREFKSSGQTATIERGFMITQTVQPGLTTENRVVFDADPAVKAFTFTGLGMQFEVAVP